jgi:hypothetical protein
MAHIEKYVATVTTTTGLIGTGYTPNIGSGYVVSVVTDGTISSTADLTIKGETNGQDILVSTTVGTSGTRYIRQNTVINSTGGTSTGSSLIPVANERIEVSVAASSASALVGTLTFMIEGA